MTFYNKELCNKQMYTKPYLRFQHTHSAEGHRRNLNTVPSLSVKQYRRRVKALGLPIVVSVATGYDLPNYRIRRWCCLISLCAVPRQPSTTSNTSNFPVDTHTLTLFDI